jgi:hypothetical protein
VDNPNGVLDAGLNELLRQRAEEAKEAKRILMGRKGLGMQMATWEHRPSSRNGLVYSSATTAAGAVTVPLNRPCGAAIGVSSRRLVRINEWPTSQIVEAVAMLHFV